MNKYLLILVLCLVGCCPTPNGNYIIKDKLISGRDSIHYHIILMDNNNRMFDDEVNLQSYEEVKINDKVKVSASGFLIQKINE